MRLFLFAICCFVISFVNSQKIPDGFIPSDFHSPKNNFGYQNTPLKSLGGSLKTLKDVICDGGECKERSYDKIEFTDDGMSFYVSGRIWKSSFKGNKYFRIIPKGNVFHASTGEIATSMVYNKYGVAKPDKFYHLTYPNGNDHVTQKIDEQGIIKQRMVYNEDGSLAMNYQVPFNGLFSDPVKCLDKNYKKCVYSVFLSSDKISIDASQRSIYQDSYGGFYTGYATAGTYKSKAGYTAKGYFLPMMHYSFGNGSVLLVTNNATGKKKWVVYTGTQVTYEMDADDNADLDIDFLHNNLDVTYFGIEETKNRAEISEKGLTFMPVISAESKDFDANGSYLLILKSTNGENEFPHTTKQMGVGIVKDGKLNGPGYRVTTKSNQKESSVFKNLYETEGIHVTYEAGLFKDDVLIEGNSHTGYINDTVDIYAKNPAPGIDFKRNKRPQGEFINANVTINDLKINDKVLIEKYNTILSVVDINKIDGSIILGSGKTENVTVYPSSSDIHLYTKQTKQTNHSRTCRSCNSGYQDEPYYNNVNKTHSWTSGEMHLGIDRNGNSVRGTKTYTRDYTVREIAGYNKVICKVCKGTATYRYTNTKTNYYYQKIVE